MDCGTSMADWRDEGKVISENVVLDCRMEGGGFSSLGKNQVGKRQQQVNTVVA